VKARSISFFIALLTGLVTLTATLSPTPLEGSEISATHLVYQKPVKMKRVDPSLFLPFLDQSRKSDSLNRPRQVNCAVFAEGKSGPLRVKGTFRLRLLGRVARTAAPWESTVVVGSVDGSSEFMFGADDILGLVSEATAAGAGVELFRIDFDGGKGKKVTVLTMDCLHEDVPL